MASSALYRYFPSRDDLLTRLIIDAYEAVGQAATEAEAAVRRKDFSGRWMAIARAVREWAVQSPQEYALIFGSPVPGYKAPQDTIDPAALIPQLLMRVMADAAAAGSGKVASRAIPRTVSADLTALRKSFAPDLTEQQLARAVLAWSQIIGLISFELFGHLNNVIHDYAAHFDFQMLGVGQSLGLAKTD